MSLTPSWLNDNTLTQHDNKLKVETRDETERALYV